MWIKLQGVEEASYKFSNLKFATPENDFIVRIDAWKQGIGEFLMQDNQVVLWVIKA